MQTPHGFPMSSFDGRPSNSFSSSQGAYGQPAMYAQAQQSFTAHRSFSDLNGHAAQATMGTPQIYTAVYSGVSVYEMEVNGVAVMRRRSDSWLNATQILKVAGVDKGKRTKVLEKEILTGEHEKVQGGYGKYQGTWINYRRGREFCRQYGVEEILRPLLDYDMSSDGSDRPGQGIETPTKEQAMAANRKRFYTQNLDGRQGQSSTSGTFFSNISSTASNALAAMNKAARLNSPAPRPASAAQRRTANMQQPRSSQSNLGSQESFRGGSQQSMPGLSSERSFGAASDSAYATQSAHPEASSESQEPPRKRIKASSPAESFSQFQPNGAEVSMREGTPTEPSDSFLYHQPAHHPLTDGEVPTALAPLPHPSDRNAEEKQALILDMFHDLSRTDYTNHPAIAQLSGSDLDLPLDQSCNTALHWAATLARVSLMRLLISRGASIFRGNIAGETPLMAAVMVNNNWDFSCFPELLEILAPLIEVRDAQGRTILHTIAVACGIKGRASSSKYYLECLLEFLIRSNTSILMSSQQGIGGMPKPIGLMRFMSEMVNARDVMGNTALNLVARIGNRSIIQQLLEVQADPNIPNYRGLTAAAFLGEADGPSRSDSQAIMESPGKRATSKVLEISNEIIPALSASLSETHNQFNAELRVIQDRIDAHTAQVRDLSATQKHLSEQLEGIQSRLRTRQERKQKVQNLQRAVKEMRERRKTPRMPTSESLKLGDADREFAPSPSALQDGSVPQHQHDGEAERMMLQSRLQAYNSLNSRLSAHLTQLRARDGELEAKYRRVIALCTGTREEHVDAVLAQLVLAVESEGDPGQGIGGQDVGRVREFLRRVEMVV